MILERKRGTERREKQRGVLTFEMASLKLIPVDFEIFLKLKCVLLKVLVIVGALGLKGRAVI